MPETRNRRKNSAAMHIDLPSSKLTTFSKFSDLPGEIRILIWKIALPNSRIILLEHRRRKLDPTAEQSTGRIDRLGFRSDALPPPILFVSREAYVVASRYYKQAFSNKTGTSVAETYFNFKSDVLYLGPEYLGPQYPNLDVDIRCYQERIKFVVGNELHPHDLSQIENLAIWWDNFVNGPSTIEQYLADILSHFGNVRNVTIVSKMYCMPGFRDTSPGMYANLKFLDDMTEVSGADIKIRGLDVPCSKSWLVQMRVEQEWLKALSDVSGELPASPKPWQMPNINYNVITTPHGEELLLQEAKEAKASEMWGSGRLDEVTNQLNAIQKTLASQSQHIAASAQQDSTTGPSPDLDSLITNDETVGFYKHTNFADLPGSPPILGHALLELDHVMILFSHFEAHYYRHCPILDISTSVALLLPSSPILFWTIIMVSSRWHPTLHHHYRIFLQPYRTLLGQTLVDQIFSLESIQALALLCFWPLSVPRQVEDPSWNYCGLMTNAALKLGLNKAQASSQDPIIRTRRKTWIAVVQVNCTHSWTSGMTVSSEIVSSTRSPPLGPCTMAERRFFVEAEIWRKLAKYSSIIINFKPDIDSWSFVHGLCADLETVKDGQEDLWTAEMDVNILGSQLCIYALQLDQGKKKATNMSGLQPTSFDRDDVTSQRNSLQLAYMTAAKFIHCFSEMIRYTSESVDTGDESISAPQRYLPKHYFGLLLLSMAFIFRSKVLYTSGLRSLPSKPETHITQVYQILTSWSRDPLDEPGRAARVIRVILQAETEGQLKFNDPSSEGRPGVALLDEMIKTAREIRESGSIGSEMPPGEHMTGTLSESGMDSGKANTANFTPQLLHDPSLEWNFPWGLDLLSTEQYNFDINNIYNGFT
ncbi:hypothetical protein EG329_002856 [Mollisiaceae sp. DMI_Dod_QoI]|nr:hypothetical protein EG329_002856 [Helotiales sp. DMI_Dod_QoI]